MERVELYWKPWRLIGLMLAPVAAVVFGVRVTMDRTHSIPSLIFGTLAIAIGVGLLVVYVWQVANWRPRIVLDDEGIFDRSLGTPKIPWESILAMKIVPFQWTKLIALQLTDEEERRAALPWWKRGRGFGYGTFNVSPLATGVAAEQLLAMIVERIERHRDGLTGR